MVPSCKKMEPVLASLQDELKGKFKLVKVDGGINTDVMKELNVAALPTFIIYRNGKGGIAQTKGSPISASLSNNFSKFISSFYC